MLYTVQNATTRRFLGQKPYTWVSKPEDAWLSTGRDAAEATRDAIYHFFRMGTLEGRSPVLVVVPIHLQPL